MLPLFASLFLNFCIFFTMNMYMQVGHYMHSDFTFWHFWPPHIGINREKIIICNMKQKSESQTNAIWAVNVKYALNISLPTVYHKQTSKMTNKWGTQCSKHTVDVSDVYRAIIETPHKWCFAGGSTLHAREPLYSKGAVIAWWLQSTSAQNSVPSC